MYKIIGADQKEYGPITLEQMRQWIAEGRVNAQTLVWSETSSNWKPLGAYAEFQDLIPVTAGTSAFAPSASIPSENNTMALWGMIMGICSVVFACCCYGIPFNVLGIIFSSMALSQIKKNPGQRGRNQAITGLALSILSIVIAIVLMIVGFAFNDEILKKLEQFGKQ